MKIFVTVLSALALLGAVSAASGAPVTNDKGQTIWEQQSLYGN
ncbi:hypothetical protein [Dichotomicrobium thermohalophilum]|uniref:Uncharacterized protein n=1 Tax=Dichotomicrobium thermohalophilum TaxID=933063 RepID=A0A397QAQ7_9HYPH|nr:hypothetical protein [Dichotomicrobium thermohalophilum]RIA55301.1 hypothetical protein BXY53_0362 [Dichotomicrobium thermohalophilum]